LAADWANPNCFIHNWTVLKEGETPKPGDIAAEAIDYYSDATGHVAIVVAEGYTIGTSTIKKKISKTDWGFKKEQKGKVVFRRYVGKYHISEPVSPSSPPQR
jgi:hypothetical protein